MAYLDDNGLLYLWNKIKTLVTNAVANKVDEVPGKGLSANDYTAVEKNKLAGIANNANNYVHPSTHAATMITQDDTHRFTTDTEKAGWNNHLASKANPHTVTKAQVGLGNVDNTSDLNKPLSTATQSALGQKLNYRESFIGKADDVTSVGVCFLEAGTGNGSPDGKSAVTLYTRKGSGSNELWQSCKLGISDYYRSKNAVGWSPWIEIPAFTTVLKTKIDGMSEHAEENQNAFSHVQVGGTTLSADQKVDVLTLAAGSNITLTPDVETDKVTISTTANNYVHPITAGNKHIPSGGDTGMFLRWSADGTATWTRFKSSVGDSGDGNIPLTTSGVQAFGTMLEGTMNTKVNGLRDEISSSYAKKADIVGMYKYKGSIADASKLPTTGQQVGDVYNIVAPSIYGAAGANVAWDGNKWDSLGEIFSITTITNAQIDTICA